jgi:hypothetical protein
MIDRDFRLGIGANQLLGVQSSIFDNWLCCEAWSSCPIVGKSETHILISATVGANRHITAGAPIHNSTRDAVLSHCRNPIGEPESCIALEEVLNFETSSETLVLSGRIQHCQVSLVPEPKPRRSWKDPSAEDDDYRFWLRCLDDSENGINNAFDNICRFDRERGAQAEFLLWLSARKVTEYGIVEVCSSIAKAVMIRTRLHTRVSVSGGLLTMIGMTDLPPPSLGEEVAREPQHLF